MKPGPPPIPFPLKALRGNPGHQRLHAGPGAAGPQDLPRAACLP
jgi:hypothetical protein